MSKNFAKKASLAVALLAVVVLMLTGTFAWYTNTHAENIFTGSKSEPETPSTPVLHDDFDPETGQKEVYVENMGDEESVLYVRIKLNEFLDLSTDQYPESIAESDWVTHKPVKDGDWYHHEDCGNANSAGDSFHDYFTWHWGSDWSSGEEVKSQKWYLPAANMTGEYAVYNKGEYVDDTTDYSELTQDEKDALGLKQTPAAGICSIDYYLNGMSEAEQKAYIGWIYDFNDGWVYWSQPLKGQEATGLLLKAVETDTEKLKDYDYCYIIDVILDAVDADDLPMWIDGADSVDPEITVKADSASEEGKAALEIIKAIAVY